MHANLTEDEARVALEAMEGYAEGDTLDLEKSDVPLWLSAVGKLTQSTLSRAEAHRVHLIHQGTHPKVAAAHTFHRFGVL